MLLHTKLRCCFHARRSRSSKLVARRRSVHTLRPATERSLSYEINCPIGLRIHQLAIRPTDGHH